MSTVSQWEVGTTVPSTPTAASGTFLYGIGGGGDSPARLATAPDKRSKLSPRTPYYRRGTPTPTGSRTGNSLLGSPTIRLRGTSRARPLVRARQPPIPLADYPTPPRPAASATGQDLIDDVNAPITLEEFLFGSFPELLGGSSVVATSHDLFLGHAGPASDDLSNTVALVAMTAVRETIQGEVSQGAEEHESESGAQTLSDSGTSADSIATPSDIEEQVREIEAGLAAAAEDNATQLEQLEEAKAAPAYVPPSSPLAQLAHSDATSCNAVGNTFGEQLASTQPRKVDPLTTSFLECCSIPKFNPRRPTYTNFNLLMRLGNQWGWTPGITKTELKQMLKLCSLCARYMYAERRAQHRCDGPNLDTSSPQFDFAQSLLSFTEHSGLSSTDLASLLSRCNDCNRIVHISSGVLGHGAVLVHYGCSSAQGDQW